MAFTDIFAGAMPERSTYEAPDFRVSAGKLSPAGKPLSLSAWRFRCSTPEIADALTQLYDGNTVPDSNDNYPLAVESDATVLKMVVPPGGYNGDFKLWVNKVLTHHCDMNVFLSGEESEIGQPCGCPNDIEEMKEKAKNFRCPKPDISIRFRLADDLDLGVGEYVSRNFNVAASLARTGLERKLLDATEDHLVTATLKEIVGQKFTYTATNLVSNGTWNAAIAG